MKSGDVFRVGKKAQLYIAYRLVSSKEAYAFKFDFDNGKSDQLFSIDLTDEITILFNSYELGQPKQNTPPLSINSPESSTGLQDGNATNTPQKTEQPYLDPLHAANNWERCEITYKRVMDRNGGYSGKDWFIAEAITTDQKVLLVQSEESTVNIDGRSGEYVGSTLKSDNQKSRRIHQALVNQLLQQGWKVEADSTASRNKPWYEVSMTKKSGRQ